MEDSALKSFSSWEILYFVSTYILALVAVIGFWSSQKSSENVSKALKVIQRGLSSLSEPLLKFRDYQWVVGKNGTNVISVDNPPQGIMFSYANVSNVPIQIVDSEFKVYYGDKLLDEPTTPMGTETKETFILAPNEHVTSGTTQADVFEKYLGKPKDRSLPPHINVKLDVSFKTMDGELFSYKVHREMHFDIRQPGLQTSKTLMESIERKS
ncbi:TPA: hypothetical protein ACPVXA_004624 [Vibrio parahaemolyticus]|uniref:hypothetical protein n=1 Tax=Vibrio TaxID=662 RepID=UPI0009272C48|nr:MULTISPECIES: hypothetical protein [Vibrio]EIJ2230974.1 hypothetical protein [Vibrio parahaemolyticus]EJE8549707.1 hypothetical protein [Vibrio vulnificus]EJF4094257.1 hypothetical protein [Vibrio parahaemolyticus]EJG0303400.1 hypothetical protein [Vibrio parahaemolyticus]EJG0516839.1 hypothetical protein [Vibrio parahaemolyticus]